MSSESPATSKTWFHGTGRRKESVARVFLRAGSGKFTINKRTVDVYFPNFAWKHDAIEPLKFTSLSDHTVRRARERDSSSPSGNRLAERRRRESAANSGVAVKVATSRSRPARSRQEAVPRPAEAGAKIRLLQNPVSSYSLRRKSGS